MIFIGKIEPIVYGSRSFGRFYVLRQPDGKRLVVQQAVEPASAASAARRISAPCHPGRDLPAGDG